MLGEFGEAAMAVDVPLSTSEGLRTGEGGIGSCAELVVCFTHQLNTLAFDCNNADDSCFLASSILKFEKLECMDATLNGNR